MGAPPAPWLHMEPVSGSNPDALLCGQRRRRATETTAFPSSTEPKSPRDMPAAVPASGIAMPGRSVVSGATTPFSSWALSLWLFLGALGATGAL